MSSLGGYPAGAEGSSLAPWNEEEDEDKQPIDVGLTVYATVKLSLIVSTEDYDTDNFGYLLDVNNKEKLAKDNIHLPDGMSLDSIDDVTIEESYTLHKHSDYFDD